MVINHIVTRVLLVITLFGGIFILPISLFTSTLAIAGITDAIRFIRYRISTLP